MLHMGEQRAPIPPPVMPVPWGIHGMTGVSWMVEEQWHYIFGSCVIKSGPCIDLGQDPHVPSSFGVNFICEGRVRYRDRQGREWPLGPGDAFQRLPGLGHTLLIDSERFVESYFSIRTRTYEALRALGQIEWRALYRPRDPLALRDAFALIFGLLDSGTSADAPRLLVEFQRLLALLREEAPGASSGDEHRQLVAAACRRLDCELAQPIDLHLLAEELGVGYENFRKIFKARMGVAPGAYRVQKRIDRACALLTNSNHPVGHIAEQLGYSDAFSFSAQFKRSIGLSPSAYRRRRPV